MATMDEKPRRRVTSTFEDIQLEMRGCDLDDIPGDLRRHPLAGHVSAVKGELEHPDILVVTIGEHVVDRATNVDLDGGHCGRHRAKSCVSCPSAGELSRSKP
jgi:hypothetical protein